MGTNARRMIVYAALTAMTLLSSSPRTHADQSSGYNAYAIFTQGTPITNGGADHYYSAYNSNLLGTSASFNGSTFTFGQANAPNAYSNETVRLPAGNYKTLNMLATAEGGTMMNQTFVVHYADGTDARFTQCLSDWISPQKFPGETEAITMANLLDRNGSPKSKAAYIYGYTFALNGKPVQSITLPATRQVIAFGFAGR